MPRFVPSSAAHILARLVTALIGCLVALVLSGCFLISGATRSADQTADGGNAYLSYVSAEGTETIAITTAFPSQPIAVTVFAQNRNGQMRVEILDAQNSVVLSVEGTAQERVGQATVQTDPNGTFRYRIRATGAQRGSLTILYQPAS